MMVADDTRARLGRAIRARREQLGLSQEELADRLGRSQSLVSRLERGAADWPDPAMFRALAAALELPPAELLEAAGYLEAGERGQARLDEATLYHMVEDSVRRGGYTAEEREAILGAIRLAQAIHRRRRGAA